MGETLRPPREGWQPLIERSLAALPSEALPAQVWRDAAQRRTCLKALGQLLELVLLWNRRVDLTAARSAEELVDLYLADAWVLAASDADDGSSWIDVGSGAGAPGLVLQLLWPARALTLVEPRNKRVAFLRTAIGQLRLHTQIEAERSESLRASACDVAISRATLPPEEWLAEGARLARQRVWVLLARGAAPSRPGWQATSEVDYEWPLTQVPRRALCFTRTPAPPPDALGPEATRH
jgi:16S rRNA (guanine527-N7)-methyltransferase